MSFEVTNLRSLCCADALETLTKGFLLVQGLAAKEYALYEAELGIPEGD